MFDTNIYQKRREILKREVGSGLILLLGNEQSSINFADNHYPFRQDSSYLYYVGIAKPHQAVVIDIDEDKEILFADDPTIDEVIWTGPVPSREELAEEAGIEDHLAYDEIVSYLESRRADRKLHWLPPYRPEHTLKLQQWLNIDSEQVAAKSSKDLIKAIVAQRSIKSRDEINYIEQAVNVTGKMHLEAMRTAKPGMTEYEVMSHVEQMAHEENAELAFPIILTVNGQILHNHERGNTIEETDLILCDAGAEHRSGYAGDMTRTFPAGSTFNGLQRELYTIVLEAELAAIEALAPGRPFKEIHLEAARVLTMGLKDMGLMKGRVDDAVHEGAHTLFFQCGLGHMMGLDVHDMENLGEAYVGYTPEEPQSGAFGLKSLRLGRELQPGFVVTVEPGLYFIPELIQLRKEQGRYRDFVNYAKAEELQDAGGYRVEDDFIITEEGARLLGIPIPKSADAIEAIRKEALQT